MSMKSLPRSPVASTQSTFSATLMAKAFESHDCTNDTTERHSYGNASSSASAGYKQKRGLSEMMMAPAPPPTPSHHHVRQQQQQQQQQSSYLDCQSLQSSLKRVRLSSSPGELRLQRDLHHMVSAGSWVPKQQQQQHPSASVASSHHNSAVRTSDNAWVWHPPAPPVRQRHQHHPYPRIELQQVESLRLRLTFASSEASMVVAWIQIPRLYPHKPPLISRIVHPPSIHNNNNNNTSNNTTIMPIQSILVHEASPLRSSNSNEEESSTSVVLDTAGSPQSQNSHNTNTTSTLQCANTVVYNDWSPVQRLGDLLEFVISTFQCQHEEQQKLQQQHQHQQQRSPNNNNNNNNTNPSGTDHPHHNDVTLTYSSSSLSSSLSMSSSWSNSRRSSVSSLGSSSTGPRSSSSSLIFPGWSATTHKNREDTTTLMEMSHNKNEGNRDSTKQLTTFLTPNRFDKGYDRILAAGGTMEVDGATDNTVPHPQQQQQQQEAMMMDML